MKYTLQEGSFSLFPAAWQDNSMNIIRDDESGLSVVVSRGVIPDGSDYEKEFHRQWELLRPQMGEIAQSAFQSIKVGPDGKLTRWKSRRPLTVTDSAFGKTAGRTNAGQAGVDDFTLSALRAFTAEDEGRWSALKQSLTLNDNRNV